MIEDLSDHNGFALHFTHLRYWKRFSTKDPGDRFGGGKRADNILTERGNAKIKPISAQLQWFQ